MSATAVWAVIVGMALANLALRFAPIAAVSRLRLPAPVLRFLSFVPVSVMAALVAGEVLRPQGLWLSPLENPYLLAALPTAFVYLKTRSLLGATIAGIAFFVLARYLLSAL